MIVTSLDIFWYEKPNEALKIKAVTETTVGEDGKPQFGHKKLVKGEKSFFLQPGEHLENGSLNVFVLGEDEGLVLRSLEHYQDDTVNPPVERHPAATRASSAA